MGLAFLLRRKDFVPEKKVCVETCWWRIPEVDTPDMAVMRSYLRDTIDHDPLSRKYTHLYLAKGRSCTNSKAGVPVLLAAHDYLHSIPKEALIYFHQILTQAIILDQFDLTQENLFNYLKSYLRELSKLCPLLNQVVVPAAPIS